MTIKLFSFSMIFLLFIISCDRSDQKRYMEDYKNVQKIDSLKKENFLLRKSNLELMDSIRKENLKGNKIKLYSIKGSFTNVWLGDCFQLTFKDENNKLWNFESVDNIYGVDLFDRKNSIKFRKGILQKKYILTYALLKGIDCQDADSYYEENKIYILMPTIIDLEEVSK